ncbi:hypothetical protein [Nocardioides dongxiaopingii]|uniref:hypothetical protein n=1 Tax=Nocardioides dongxiaopingii TaxID=2576036 RepID=UPI0010C767A3|nr:hypothetical protein [Nocardioides dongxiaopingii]
MTSTDHLIALVAMAIAVTTILTVGTLAAADLIPRPRRRGRTGGEPGAAGPGEPAARECATSEDDGHLPHPLAPLGSALLAGTCLRERPGDAGSTTSR